MMAVSRSSAGFHVSATVEFTRIRGWAGRMPRDWPKASGTKQNHSQKDRSTLHAPQFQSPCNCVIRHQGLDLFYLKDDVELVFEGHDHFDVVNRVPGRRVFRTRRFTDRIRIEVENTADNQLDAFMHG